VKVNRWRAAAIHLGISAAIALATSLLIAFVWYPGPLLDAFGGKLLIALVIGVDMCLGPLVTCVIFNPEKRRALLLLDFSIIAILQVSALAYGLYATFEGRPVYVAYGQGYFVAASANQVDDGMLKAGSKPEFQSLPLYGPRWVGTREPVDPHEVSDLNFALGMTGMGIHYQPKYYVTLEMVEAELAKLAKPVANLRERNPDMASTLDQAMKKIGRTDAEVGFLPLKTKQKMLSVLVDRHSGKVLDTVAIPPV
jgi:hypothetical protein